MSDSAANRPTPSDRPGNWPVLLLLAVAGVTLTWAGSIHPPTEQYWLDSVARDVPGMTDVCGSPTLLARSVPAMLVLLGIGLSFLGRRGHRLLGWFRVIGLALALLLFLLATMSFDLGVLSCIVD
jgi:hypothetical protein